MKKLLLLILALMSITINAQKLADTNLDKGIALQGYDPVAYFADSKAIKGNQEFTVNYKGAEYFFTSEENKKMFSTNPSQYEPQYGGYCAFGLSNGYKAPIDPQAFTIVNDKLYLNYSLKVKELWLKEQADRIQKANKNWEALKKS